MSESTALLTPEGVAAWPSLFTAKLPKNPKPKDRPMFSTAILFEESATKTSEWAALVAAVVAAGTAKWGREKFEAMLREESVDLPFLKNVTTKGYPPNFFRFINISSGEQYPPAVVGRDGIPLKDTRAIISGTRIRASVSVRAYGGPGTEYKAGIKLDMRNIQKLGEGTPLPLGGASDPKKDFGDPLPPINEPPPAAMPGATTAEKSLADLMG